MNIISYQYLVYYLQSHFSCVHKIVSVRVYISREVFLCHSVPESHLIILLHEEPFNDPWEERYIGCEPFHLSNRKPTQLT